jgi:hypothetical protein
MHRLAIVILAGLVLAFGARADIIPQVQSGPLSLGGGEFQYVYQATVSDLERLDPTATAGVTCLGTTVNPVQCNPAGTFFTIYDVGGLDTAATTAAPIPSGWGVSFNLVGLTPSTITLPDGSSIFNVTFAYTGPVVQGPATFTGFELISTSDSLTLGDFSGQATDNSTGLTDQNDGFIELPAGAPDGGTTPTPEPASLVLLGSGLLGLGAAARKNLRP